jgi:hypothetical protein
MHNVKIDLSTPTTGKVYLDGVEVHGVTSISLNARAGGRVHELVLTLMPKTVEVTGLADVTKRHVSLKNPDA